MIEGSITKNNFNTKHLFLYLIVILFILLDIIQKQIFVGQKFFPEFYILMFFIITASFSPMRAIMSLFIVGIIEDSILNNYIGVSSCCYLLLFIPFSKLFHIFKNNIFYIALTILVFHSLLSLVKWMLANALFDHYIAIDFSLIKAISTTIASIPIALIYKYCY